MFAAVLFNVLAGLAIFRLRRTHAHLPRPYRTWGYPLVPLVFVAGSLGLVVNTLLERPVESVAGLLLMAAGLPAYGYWREASRPGAECRILIEDPATGTARCALRSSAPEPSAAITAPCWRGPDTTSTLIARGAHLAAIRERGLTVRAARGEFTVQPRRIRHAVGRRARRTWCSSPSRPTTTTRRFRCSRRSRGPAPSC